MTWLIKSALSVVLLFAAAYVVLAVDLGDKPLAAHVQEIWSSDVVQSKVTRLERHVRGQVDATFADAADRARVAQDQLQGGKRRGEFDVADRQRLDALLDRN